MLPLTIAQLQLLRDVAAGRVEVTRSKGGMKSRVQGTDVTKQMRAMQRRGYVRHTRPHSGPIAWGTVLTDIGAMRLAIEDAVT